jgi:hypothetical protein
MSRAGLWAKIELGGARYYVHRRFHAVAHVADAPPMTAVLEARDDG